MNKLALMAAGVLLLAGFGWAAEGDVKVAGGGTVPAPAEGFVWQKVREADEAVGKVEFFVATKEGSASKVVLIVEQAAADSDAKRVARIKGDFNGMVTSLQERGYTELKGSKPPLTPPIADRVEFLFTGKDKEGATMVFEGILLFGKSTYHFQVVAQSEEEVKALAKVADRVEE